MMITIIYTTKIKCYNVTYSLKSGVCVVSLVLLSFSFFHLYCYDLLPS